MSSYKVLQNQEFTCGQYRIVPIRMEDRFAIMKWRNDQIYHLRQTKPLTNEDQNNYFGNVVSQLFDHHEPDQILFSYLKGSACIGYGGLVHINWQDRNAEISFIMDTELERDHFSFHWDNYLELIEQVAFEELNLHKVFTYAFDLRPYLYEVIERAGYLKEAVLKDHIYIENSYKDVVIHSKLNETLRLRSSSKFDENVTYDWAKNPIIRRFAFNSTRIMKSEHQSWYQTKMTSEYCEYYILIKGGIPIGSVRFDLDEDRAVISYLIDPEYHGKGYGYNILKLGENKLRNRTKGLKWLEGSIRKDNIASIKTFERLNYQLKQEEESTRIYIKAI